MLFIEKNIDLSLSAFLTKLLTKLEIVSGTEQRGLQLTEHSRGEFEGFSEVIRVQSLLHEEGLLAHHRHVLVQDAVLIIIHHHFDKFYGFCKSINKKIC